MAFWRFRATVARGKVPPRVAEVVLRHRPVGGEVRSGADLQRTAVAVDGVLEVPRTVAGGKVAPGGAEVVLRYRPFGREVGSGQNLQRTGVAVDGVLEVPPRSPVGRSLQALPRLFCVLAQSGDLGETSFSVPSQMLITLPVGGHVTQTGPAVGDGSVSSGGNVVGSEHHRLFERFDGFVEFTGGVPVVAFVGEQFERLGERIREELVEDGIGAPRAAWRRCWRGLSVIANRESCRSLAAARTLGEYSALVGINAFLLQVFDRGKDECLSLVKRSERRGVMGS